MSDLIQRFKAARRVSTPICCVRTPDPAATMATLEAGLNGTAPPILLWDIARGLQWRNQEGLKVESENQKEAKKQQKKRLDRERTQYEEKETHLCALIGKNQKEIQALEVVVSEVEAKIEKLKVRFFSAGNSDNQNNYYDY